jgi:hypothetical protein
MRKKFIAIVLLEVIACLAVYIHLKAGVLTDEAKYLLSIPYPHPPVVREMMAWTKGWEWQEWFWRLVFASVMIQSIWLFASAQIVQEKKLMPIIALCFLFSPAIFLQSGTIMLVVPAAAFGMLMICTLLHPSKTTKIPTILFGILWLVALLSVYHSILFAPLVWSAMQASQGTVREKKICFYGPILLLILYSLSHPLALASMIGVTKTHTSLSLIARGWDIADTILRGSGLLTLTGIIGAIVEKNRPLLLSLFATLALICLSPQNYYVILLVPSLLAGTLFLLQREKISSSNPRIHSGANILLALHIPLSILIITQNFPSQAPSVARETIAWLSTNQQMTDAPILIDGPFGHEWQYYSPLPLRKFSPTLRLEVEKQSQLLICTKQTSCESDIDETLWKKKTGTTLEVWERR